MIVENKGLGPRKELKTRQLPSYFSPRNIPHLPGDFVDMFRVCLGQLIQLMVQTTNRLWRGFHSA